jgi:tetratricopeptide (TPR) repeat protein
MSKQLPLTIDGWLQWLHAVNVQAEAHLEHGNANDAKMILRDGLGQFRQCHPKAPSLLQPAVVRSLNNLARTYELLRNPQKALKCLEKARSFIAASSMIHNSAEVDTHANLAAVFTKLGRLSQAIEHCNIALRLLQPLLLDDDIDATLHSRARKFLIVSYNLAVAQSRLKLFEDAIGSSGRHLKIVHAILPSDDPIRRKLIDFRRHLVERMQQQLEDFSSEADDPFSGTFVDVSSSQPLPQPPPRSHQSLHHSEAEADRESNVIFPAQRIRSDKLDGLNLKADAPPTAPKNAWGDDVARASSHGRLSALVAASMKENAGAQSNFSSQSLFDRKASSARTREHAPLLSLQEDVPSSGTASAASSHRAPKEPRQMQSYQPQAGGPRSDERDAGSCDVDVPSASAPPPATASVLHMLAHDEATSALSLQVPDPSSLHSSKTSAIVSLQRACRRICCRDVLRQARIENARVLLGASLLRMHPRQRHACTVANDTLYASLLRLHSSRRTSFIIFRVRALDQLRTALLRHAFHRRLLAVKRACAAAARVCRGHLIRKRKNAPRFAGSVVIVQRQWRRYRAVQVVARAMRLLRVGAVLLMQHAVVRYWDLSAAKSAAQ